MNTKINWIEDCLENAVQLIYGDQLQEGLKAMNDLLYEEPGYSNLHNHLGWAYFYYTPDTERAELHLKLAVRFDADNPAPYLHLSTLYLRTDRPAEALALVSEGLNRPKANRVALLETRAHAYEVRRNYREAIRAYKDALAASSGEEGDHLMNGIKRCRKKRWVLMF